MKITAEDFPWHKLDRLDPVSSKGVGGRKATEGTWVVLDSDVQEYMPPFLYTKFLEWMRGQTMMKVGDEAGYYPEDINNFLQGRKVTD